MPAGSGGSGLLTAEAFTHLITSSHFWPSAISMLTGSHVFRHALLVELFRTCAISYTGYGSAFDHPPDTVTSISLPSPAEFKPHGLPSDGIFTHFLGVSRSPSSIAPLGRSREFHPTAPIPTGQVSFDTSGGSRYNCMPCGKQGIDVVTPQASVWWLIIHGHGCVADFSI